MDNDAQDQTAKVLIDRLRAAASAVGSVRGMLLTPGDAASLVYIVAGWKLQDFDRAAALLEDICLVLEMEEPKGPPYASFRD